MINPKNSKENKDIENIGELNEKYYPPSDIAIAEIKLALLKYQIEVDQNVLVDERKKKKIRL